MVKGPSEVHPVFTVSLDGVAMDHEKVKGAVACVQDFVRHPSFTQRSFFSETGIGMLNSAVTAADAREGCVPEEGVKGYTGAVIQCRNRCFISCR